MGTNAVPDRRPHRLAQEPLVTVGGLGDVLEIGSVKRPQFGQGTAHTAPHAGEDQIAVRVEVTHDVEVPTAFDPGLHRAALSKVELGIAVPHEIAVDLGIVGDMKAPEQSFEGPLRSGH